MPSSAAESFSLLIPSRSHVDGLNRLLQSVICRSVRLELVEILVCIDYNDCLAQEYTSMIDRLISSQPSLDIKLVTRKQSDNLCNDYFNLLAACSQGEVLWVLSDDAEIVTDKWDFTFLNKLSSCGISLSGIWYFDVADSTRNLGNCGQFSCFPMLTRKAYETLGFFFLPQVRTWAADKFLHQIFCETGRIAGMPDVFVQHHREVSGENFEKMQRVYLEDAGNGVFDNIEINLYTERIRTAVHNRDNYVTVDTADKNVSRTGGMADEFVEQVLDPDS